MIQDQETEQDPVVKDGIYELSNKVRLKVEGTVAPVLMMDIAQMAGADEPQPPMAHVAEKERDEPNPSDPDYIADHDKWTADTQIRLLRALVTSLTKLESYPSGMVGPESEEFAEFVEAVGLQPARSDQLRYVQWVFYVALTEKKDFIDLGVVLMRQSGAREEDVAEAQALFRGGEERDSDNGASPGGNRADRRRVSRARSRSGASTGGA